MYHYLLGHFSGRTFGLAVSYISRIIIRIRKHLHLDVDESGYLSKQLFFQSWLLRGLLLRTLDLELFLTLDPKRLNRLFVFAACVCSPSS